MLGQAGFELLPLDDPIQTHALRHVAMERMEERAENKQPYIVESWTQAGRDAVILFHIGVDWSILFLITVNFNVNRKSHMSSLSHCFFSKKQ